MAEEIGSKIHKKKDNKCFSDVVLKKSDQVKTLLHLQKGVVVDKKRYFYIQLNCLLDSLCLLKQQTWNKDVKTL